MLPSLTPYTWMLALGKFVTIKNVYVRYKFQQRVSMGSIHVHYNSGAQIHISSCLLFLNDAIYLYACPFGTFATTMAAYGHSTVLNRVIEVGGM